MPTGRTVASRTMQKMANCSQPLEDISEFLREKQRECEISQQENRKYKRDCRNPFDVHGLPQLLACLDVEKRQDEKNYGEQHHHCVLHTRTPSISSAKQPAPGRGISQTTD